MKIPELLKSNMRGSRISLSAKFYWDTVLAQLCNIHIIIYLLSLSNKQTKKKDVAITAAGIRHDFWGFRYYEICNKLCGTDFVVTHLNILLFTNTCHKAMYLYSPLR